jgi:hypothetical protein
MSSSPLAGWDLTVRQALRDAIRYQRQQQPEDWESQVGLYESLARRLGVDLGAGLDEPAAGDTHRLAGNAGHSAELQARITAAQAAAADFRRAMDDYLDHGASRPDMSTWCWGLHTMLTTLLDELQRGESS